MKPFKFEPFLKTTIWGGKQIAAFKNIDIDKQNVGESWEISDIPGCESIVASGSDKGLTLVELIKKYKELLVGKKVYAKFGDRFPLLVKFIDSHQNLSVQVHPNDELAMKRHHCPGKSEMWYVINAEPGAKIYTGLRKEITPEQYERMVTTETVDGYSPIMDVIATYEAHSGDIYFLPAGRLHAIGAGCFLAEIQETSDITYRVYDYGRRDANGNTRELHIEQAKDAIDYHVYPEYRSTYDSTLLDAPLVHCPFFNVNRVVVHEAMDIDYQVDSFVIVLCLRGEATVNGMDVRQGESLLVPACNNKLYFLGNGIFLTATI
ncbi:MAG: class I mannose-6-phosphate isomerase [Bacteroidales bacterium]|nr:class I mannose-6-phosphate isomerase [Bacteroidales bacterium]